MKYVERVRIISGILPGIGFLPEMDDAGVRRAEDAFELRCKEHCLDLTDRATKLDPANAEWWRIRALLLWRHSRYSYEESPRCLDWSEVLNECATHDPDNALYEYLATQFYWESSAEIDFTDDDARLIVKDAERFQLGVDCFERGQDKPLFAVGDDSLSAVLQFLNNSRLTAPAHEPVVNSRGIHLRRSRLLTDVTRWQDLRAGAAAVAGNFSSALAMARRICTSSTSSRAGLATAHDDFAVACRLRTTARLNRLARQHGDAFAEQELADCQTLEEDARLDQKVMEQAGQVLTAGQRPLATGGAMASSTADMIWLQPPDRVRLHNLG